MKQKITVKLNDDRELVAFRPAPDSDYVELEMPCPGCGAASPLKVSGANRRHDFDTYYADAVTRCCSGHVGTIQVKVNTLFGIEEDEAVLQGRCRVY